MADSDRADKTSEGAGGRAPRSEELDALLQRIARHVAQVEQGGPAQPAPASPAAPAEAGRAAASAELDDGAAAAEEDAIEALSARNDRSHWAAAAQRATPVLRVAVPAVEPPVLRSKPATSAPADSEDVADAAWDRHAAEALTRVYEDSAAATGSATPDPVAVREARAKTTAVGARLSGADVAPVNKLLDVAAQAEVEAAEARLMAAARRVEAALEEVAPRALVEALGDRLEILEEHLSQTGAQLGRLDDIEHRLGELGGKLSDEEIVRLFGSLVPTAEELAQLAEDAASKTADRILAALPEATGGSVAPAISPIAERQVGQLAELLSAFMDERRRSDAGTLEALETMQLAMQHLLDRLENADIEGPGEFPHAEAMSYAPTASYGGEMERLAPVAMPLERPPEAERMAEAAPPARGAAPVAAAPFAVSPAAGSASVPPLPVPPPALSQTAPPHQFGGVPHATRDDEAAPPRRQAPARTSAADQASATHLEIPTTFQPAQRPPMPEASGQSSPPPSDRQALIAMARKAAERAKSQTEEKKPEVETGASGWMKALKAAPTAEADPAAKASAGVRPGVLVIATLAAFLLAGYWFLGAPKIRLPGTAPAAVGAERAPAPVVNVPPTAKRSVSGQPKGAAPDIEQQSSEPAERQPAERQPVEPAPAGRPAAKKMLHDEAPAIGERSTLQSAHVLGGSIETGPFGITLHTSDTGPSPQAIDAARQRAQIANLSGEAAKHAAANHAVPVSAEAVPQPAAPATTALVTGAVAPAERPSTKLVLPPATVGPLSLRLAAAKGDAAAQFEVATRMAEGKGVPQDFAEAAAWYQKAAQQGHALSQYRLATLYERGTGVKADPARARIWYQRAGELGNLKAMHNLAVLSTNKVGGHQPDYDTAARLFKTAADHGLADSQYNLAVLLERGLGAPKDLLAAYKWYALAAKAGDADAARRRDLVISRLSTEALQTGNREIAAWRPLSANGLANNPHLAGEAWKQQADGKQ